MVMLAPANAVPQAERPRVGPAWARLPLERASRQAPAEDATSSFFGGAGVYGTYLDEVLMMRNSTGTKYYYHANHLYSVHAITNSAGAIVEAVQSYDAYGKPTIITGAGTDATWFTGDDVTGSVSAIGNPWFYTGQRLDAETGLMYYKNRYYSAELGRFVGRDPIGYEGVRRPRFMRKPNLHLYSYVMQRPSNHVDSYGLWTVTGLIEKLKKCDEARAFWDKVTRIYGKDPEVKASDAGKEFKGYASVGHASVELSSDMSDCEAVQVLLFELHNLEDKTTILSSNNACKDGNISREGFIRMMEEMEYYNAHGIPKFFAMCKEDWECSSCEFEWIMSYRTFEVYFVRPELASHKEHYGKWWDRNCKEAYERKPKRPTGQDIPEGRKVTREDEDRESGKWE
ncbi:MAG: hypothetical protein AMXMBFR7_50580 [Planctomycetota bacterium]